jgi:hypothetical protein
MSFLNPPRDWSVGEVLTAAHMDEISAALTALGPGTAGTTISGIQTATGAVDGMRAILRNNVGDRMALVYDSNLGKWVGPEVSYPLLAGTDSFAGSGIASGAAVEALTAARSIAIPCKPWTTAGLKPQVRFRGMFGLDFTGSTTSREVRAYLFGFNAGATNPYGNGAGTSNVTLGAAAASPSFHVTPWDSPGTTPDFDWMFPSFYFVGIGTGTYAYAAKHVSAAVRWVSI